MAEGQEPDSKSVREMIIDRWSVVADVMEATAPAPQESPGAGGVARLWVFDADVVIFKVPTLELPGGRAR